MPDDGAASTAPTTLLLPVGDGHTLYVETVGRRDGIPAVFLHGGPGSGCQPSHRDLFDRNRHYAVLFDQRGAGRSTPHGSRVANTTAHLIADMELIRATLGIERWLVVGGSWGATLALAYAEAHPSRVRGIVLRATFLGTRYELERAFGTVAETFYPGLYRDFTDILPEAERATPLDSYFRRILDPDPGVHGPAARAYALVEDALSTARPSRDRLDLAQVNNPAGRVPPTALMEAHYFSNDSFLAPGQLMGNIGCIADIPGIIVQGRYDLLCPPITSAELARTWPRAKLRMVEGAGHRLGEPGVTEAVRESIAELTSGLAHTPPG